MVAMKNALVTESSCNQSGINTIDVMSLPWVFTNRQPLNSRDFIQLAKKRGVSLDELKLRQLYKYKILTPLIAITPRRRYIPTKTQTYDEPQYSHETYLSEFRKARNDGRLLDLNSSPFFRKLFTSRPSHNLHWGLIYSHHQLIVLPKLDNLLARCHYSYRNKQSYPHLPEPDFILKHKASWYHRIALMATALEARYLPVLDPERIQLININLKEYKHYCQSFDPVSMSEQLNYPPEQVQKDAEELLALAHYINPLGGPWSQLLKKAPRHSWKHLKNDALFAMDLRETAEILLLFYEDLTRRDMTTALPVMSNNVRQPLDERLSEQPKTLDQDLMDLGLSPHPRVVLAIEGESEEIHIAKVRKKLGHLDTPELVHFMKLGGVDKDITKLAAFVATPLVRKKDESGKFWWINKPPTLFMVVADPEGKYSPNKINDTKRLILEEIKAILAVQGAKTTESELQELVKLHVWEASCYEYAHFTNEELADGIAQIHTTCNGLSREELIAVLEYWRTKNKDIKQVWNAEYNPNTKTLNGKWEYQVSKTKLAEVLWSVLEQKIERAMADPGISMPPIAKEVQLAFRIAQCWRHKIFVLTATSID